MGGLECRFPSLISLSTKVFTMERHYNIGESRQSVRMLKYYEVNSALVLLDYMLKLNKIGVVYTVNTVTSLWNCTGGNQAWYQNIA